MTEVANHRFAASRLWRSLHVLLLFALVGPAWSQAPAAPAQAAQPTQQTPVEPKRSELRKAVQTREASVPPRQLSAQELQRLREQIREQGARARTTTLAGDRP